MDTSQLTQIFIIILALIVVWVILRFVLRLAGKIFSLGCGLIVLLGIILVVLRLVRGA